MASAKKKPSKAKRNGAAESPAREAMKKLHQKDARWLIGKSARTLRGRPDCPRNPDGSYCAAEVVRWHLARSTGDEDPLAGDNGSASAALERFRLARAEDAELDLSRKRGQIVALDELLQWWHTEVAGPIRGAVELLEQRFGSEAAKIVSDAIDEAGGALERRAG